MNIKLLVESGNDFADNDNYGDRAIFDSTVLRLRRMWPDCEIRWITAEANFERARGAGAKPVSAADIISDDTRTAILRDCDLVLATGGGYFTDSFAPHACRVLDTLAAGLRLGKPAAILSCGFEPISDRQLTAKMLAVLPNLGLVVCREPLQSPDVLRSVGVSIDRLRIAGDEAVGFAFDRRPAVLGGGLGINLRCADYAGVGPGTIADLRSMLHGAIAALDAPIVSVPISAFGPSDVDAIQDLVADFADRVDSRRALGKPEDVVARVGDCRLVITGSYHAAVFALSQGVSVVALVASSHYRSKFRGLKGAFAGTGIEIVELGRETTAAALTQAIANGWRDAPAVRADLLREAERQVGQIDMAYESVGGLLAKGHPARLAAPISAVRRVADPVTHVKPTPMPEAKLLHSMPALSAAEIDTFREQGYLGPFTAFDPQRMQQARQTILERVLATPTRYCPFGLRVRHLDSRTVYDLCSSPEIIGRMASLYGPDLVLWNSNLFNKPPARPEQLEEYPWHQDHYNWNMEPVLNISAWLAIGPATEENGCVQVIPGSHRQIVPPVTDTNPDLSLRFGGVASDPRFIDESKKVSLPLQSGQFFLFNERLLHHSNPNRTSENRLGLAIRVTVPIVKVSEPFPCVLLSGEDRMGFNRYAEPPLDEPDADWLAALPLGHAFEFDRPIPGMGWHLLENDGRNRFAWTGLEPAAWLDFRPAGAGNHVLRWEVVHAISQAAVDSAVLRVNGIALDVERSQQGDVVVLEARVSEPVLRRRPDRVRVQLDGCQAQRPCDLNPGSSDKRQLGLGVRRVSLVPAGG